MVFSSPTFLFGFLPAVLVAHAVLRGAPRNWLLLLASLAFYAWGEGRYIALMLASIVVNHALGLWIQRSRSALALGLAVALNLGALGFYKYSGWLWDNARALFEALGATTAWLGPRPEVVLPLGISFFTFQALSTLVDVRRGDARLSASPLEFGLYIACFPQLIAGPIVRYSDIAQQLVRRSVGVADFADGVRRFAIGLGKKTLLANSLAPLVDEAFALDPAQLTCAAGWLAISAWCLQIYFDFSGYSDMAIGLGRCLGFSYAENFEHPLASRSITEFWRRWHISLSTFFRDYVYIPLGGNRRGKARMYAALVCVFALTGLWHGAAWTFVVFGLYHGAVMLLERAGLGRALSAGPRWLAHLYFFVAVNVGWVFFRADDLPHAGAFLQTLFRVLPSGAELHPARVFLDTERGLALVFGVLCALPWVRWARERGEPSPAVALACDVGIVALIGASLLCAAAGAYDPFIYFRF